MKIGIVGLGLIGASFAKEFANIGHVVYGIDKDSDTLTRAISERVIVGELDDNIVSELDIVIFAVYLGATCDLLGRYAAKLKSGAIVIDTVGNKRKVVGVMRELASKYPSVIFYGGHPMAGREISGYDASRQGLFLGASMLLVSVNGDAKSDNALNKLFADIGFAKEVRTSGERHDRNIAYTSQLPHIISNAYIKSVTAACYKDFSAGSFRDLTRVAGLNTTMWTELMLDNADNLVEELDTYIASLTRARSALRSRDEAALREILDEGNAIKRELDK